MALHDGSCHYCGYRNPTQQVSPIESGEAGFQTKTETKLSLALPVCAALQLVPVAWAAASTAANKVS